MCDFFSFQKTIDLSGTRAKRVLVDANDNLLIHDEHHGMLSVLSLTTGEILDTMQDASFRTILAMDMRSDGLVCAYSRNRFPRTNELLLINMDKHTLARYPIAVEIESNMSIVVLKVVGNKSYLAISGAGDIPEIFR